MLFVGRSKVDSFCTLQLWRMLTLGLPLCCSSDTPYKMNMLNLFESPIWKRTSSSKPVFFLGIKNVSACYFSGVNKRLSCWVGLLTWWVYPLGEGCVFRRLGFIGWLVGKLVTTICSEITKLLWRWLVALWKDGSMFWVFGFYDQLHIMIDLSGFHSLHLQGNNEETQAPSNLRESSTV